MQPLPPADPHLHSEGGHLLPPPGELGVAVGGVLKVPGDVPGGGAVLVLGRHHQHALGFLPLEAGGHLLLAGLLVVSALLQLLHALHQHLHLPAHLLHRQTPSEPRRPGRRPDPATSRRLTWFSRSSRWLAWPLPLAMSQTQYWLREGGLKVCPPSLWISGMMPQPKVKEAREW